MNDDAFLIVMIFCQVLSVIIGIGSSNWLFYKWQQRQDQRPKQHAKVDYGGRVPTAEEWYRERL